MEENMMNAANNVATEIANAANDGGASGTEAVISKILTGFLFAGGCKLIYDGAQVVRRGVKKASALAKTAMAKNYIPIPPQAPVQQQAVQQPQAAPQQAPVQQQTVQNPTPQPAQNVQQ